jgi:hypothetical protein
MNGLNFTQYLKSVSLSNCSFFWDLHLLLSSTPLTAFVSFCHWAEVTSSAKKFDHCESPTPHFQLFYLWHPTGAPTLAATSLNKSAMNLIMKQETNTTIVSRISFDFVISKTWSSTKFLFKSEGSYYETSR